MMTVMASSTSIDTTPDGLTVDQLCNEVLAKNAPSELVDPCKLMKELQAKARENIRAQEKKRGFSDPPLVK